MHMKEVTSFVHDCVIPIRTSTYGTGGGLVSLPVEVTITPLFVHAHRTGATLCAKRAVQRGG